MVDNSNRFTGRANDYDLYRQRYPVEEVLTRLRAWCGLTPEWLVADIGAGTGMLAEVFLANGNRVNAVEPNHDMRAEMRSAVERHLQVAMPHLRIVDATAEATSLETASVDIVSAGRAFHWFDKERALTEFRRILKPDGWMVLVAADRDRDAKDTEFREQVNAYEQIMAAHGKDYERVRSGYRTYDSMENFLDGQLHQEKIQGMRSLDWTSFSGHTRSLSVSPQPGDPGYAGFERALREHFDTYASEGLLAWPTICWITAGRFAR
jgi:ubiquinone/menaquinone biosynthesis C-methylase UbiE